MMAEIFLGGRIGGVSGGSGTEGSSDIVIFLGGLGGSSRGGSGGGMCAGMENALSLSKSIFLLSGDVNPFSMVAGEVTLVGEEGALPVLLPLTLGCGSGDGSPLDPSCSIWPSWREWGMGGWACFGLRSIIVPQLLDAVSWGGFRSNLNLRGCIKEQEIIH